MTDIALLLLAVGLWGGAALAILLPGGGERGYRLLVFTAAGLGKVAGAA